MSGFFEPCYESGKAERWRICMADGAPFAVAGIWRAWQEVRELLPAHDQRRLAPAVAKDAQAWEQEAQSGNRAKAGL